MSTEVERKELPILFNPPNVRSILDGQKTQTRRVCKNSPGVASFSDGPMAKVRFPDDWTDEDRDYFVSTFSPYGQPGDRLWVRETWQQIERNTRKFSEFAIVDTPMKSAGGLIYAADELAEEPPAWRPSIHMPRWACRLELEVTGVRVERLCEISDEDAIKEGVIGQECIVGANGNGGIHHEEWGYRYHSVGSPLDGEGHESASEAFLAGDWASQYVDANPWVWVVDFHPELDA